TAGYRFLRRPAFRIGAVIALVLLVVAVVLPLFIGVSPYAVAPEIKLSSPNGSHLYGTDDYGRDLFSRTNAGFKVSVMIGASVA
ncbi:ABC transporter permease, partial [Bacillus sp. SIMBA_008]